MKSIEVSVEQYRDSAYQIGYLQGENLEKSLIENLSKLENASFNYTEAIEIFMKYAPHLLDELNGLADALDITQEKAASLFSGYDIPKIKEMGCSSVINKEFAVRNYDFTPDIYDRRLVLNQPKECYASAGYSLHVIGRHEGVNEKGLFISFHFVNNRETKQGLTASTIVRIILDSCKNTDEAIILLKQLPHTWSYNFSIADGEGHTAIAEVTPHEVNIREDPATLMCTNHFQHPSMRDKNRIDYINSHKRIAAMTNKNVNKFSGKEVYQWFKDPHGEMFYKDYNGLFGTLHTFAYLFNDKIILTSLPYGNTLEIEWKNWLEGYDLHFGKMKGRLEQESLS
ncbi:C45 family autoproteolytic acyltransferase/hydrolase [Virgibacillus flavescens]|uniref:C45 family autoproteolytic acyltransferase/hydolase n=1 Tax=Virgibacillus flavescens TaxID=1611422 RepID=UPI003D33C938